MMTEEELARHDSKTLLQLLLSADARCDALTADNDRLRGALADIASWETMHANATVVGMANRARAALKGEKK